MVPRIVCYNILLPLYLWIDWFSLATPFSAVQVMFQSWASLCFCSNSPKTLVTLLESSSPFLFPLPVSQVTCFNFLLSSPFLMFCVFNLCLLVAAYLPSLASCRLWLQDTQVIVQDTRKSRAFCFLVHCEVTVNIKDLLTNIVANCK